MVILLIASIGLFMALHAGLLSHIPLLSLAVRKKEGQESEHHDDSQKRESFHS
jgi:hypothetical protein